MPTNRANCTAPRNSATISCVLCVAVGGVLTGEHGVGVEKRDLMPVMFSDIDLTAAARQMRIRS